MDLMGFIGFFLSILHNLYGFFVLMSDLELRN